MYGPTCLKRSCRFDGTKIPRERAVLCADALELLRVRNKGPDLLPVPQRARPAEERCRSCMCELGNLEVEERAAVTWPTPAHRWPSSGQPAGCRGTGPRNTRGPFVVSCREGSGCVLPLGTHIPKARGGSSYLPAMAALRRLTARLSSRRSRPAPACCWTRQPDAIEWAHEAVDRPFPGPG